MEYNFWRNWGSKFELADLKVQARLPLNCTTEVLLPVNRIDTEKNRDWEIFDNLFCVQSAGKQQKRTHFSMRD